ncbi:aminopeptidase [Candidatus Woesearchaeota archaeon]|nr:aminopeptidase [Candidatus Woesearchaeota archaeon]
MRQFIEQALLHCLGLQSEDTVTVITDRETEKIGASLRETTSSLGGRPHYFVMEDFGARPRDGSSPLAFPSPIADAMRQSDISVYAATGKEGELASFRIPMIRIVQDSERIKHGHMPDVTEEVLRVGFGEDYQRVIDLTHRVYDALQGARSARVVTPAGSDFRAEFNPHYLWIPSDAIIKPGTFGNIPSGEVFTCVETCEGKVVIDGEVGDYLLARYGILHDNPVTLDVKNGRVVKVECSNKSLEGDVRKYMDVDENGNRIGEWSIGTNTNVKHFIGNLLIDEKFPGVHIALGSGYPKKTGATWDGKGHLDCIMLNPTVTVTYDRGERVILDRGNYRV